MNDHTPGPWKVDHDPDDQLYKFRVFGAEPGGHLVANVLSTAFVSDAANARLIAAAPELLAACLAVLEHPGDCLIPNWIHSILADAVAKTKKDDPGDEGDDPGDETWGRQVISGEGEPP